MKKMIIAMLAMTLFVSCDPNSMPPPFIVWGPVYIFVENEAGDNLLDPAFDGNILDDDITVEYDGETFAMEYEGNIKTDMFGLYNMGDHLEFGLFKSGYKPSRTFTINWSDGTSDDITFELYANKWGDNKEVVQKIWLNGELLSDDSLAVTIVK